MLEAGRLCSSQLCRIAPVVRRSHVSFILRVVTNHPSFRLLPRHHGYS
jgi:hypothetical protein